MSTQKSFTDQIVPLSTPPTAEELVSFLTNLAANLAVINDLDRLCSFIVERALALVSADEGQVYLETRPLRVDPAALQLTLPLRVKGEVLGVLTVTRHAPESEGSTPAGPGGFSEADKRQLTLLASIASVAIAGLKREQNARRRSDWRDRALYLLQETGRVMGSTLELAPLMRRVMDATVRALRAEAGLLALLDDNDQLVVRAVTGSMPRAVVGQSLQTEQGLIGWVTRHGRTALVPDPSADPRASSDHPASEMGFVARALLVAPLVTKGQVIGVIQVANKRKGTFDEGDLQLLEALALSAAAAIENARLYERLQRQALQQENIIRVGQAMSSAQEVNSILQEVVESVLTVIPNAFTATVHLLDEEQKELQRNCDAGRPLWDPMHESFSVGQGIAGHVFATRELANVADVLADPRYVPGPGRVVYRSLLVAPLIVEEKPLGTLSVTGLDPNAFGRHDEQMIRGLAAQAAVALRNAQLYAQSQERATQLQAAYAQLQDLAYHKTQFIQNTSHELRTPLTFVRGYLELLLSGELGALAEQQQSVLEIMEIKSQRLVDLVNDIGTLLEVELRPADIEPVDLVDVVARSVLTQRERAKKASVVIETEWPEIPPIVQGNRHRLIQVFNHVLENAIKFSPDGGQVQVCTWSELGHAFVRVADQGIGISLEEQKYIFDRFYQVDGSTTRRFGGTGLGLAIVKETIEAHGGVVHVESSGIEGEGTAFTLSLPLLAGDNANEPEAQSKKR